MSKNIKTLLFEGAGMDYKSELSDVGNYRIRTAFLDNEGNKIYLELGGCEFVNKKFTEWRNHVDHKFNISISTDENVSRLAVINNMVGYSKKEITKFVNENFKCNFDTIEVLDSMEDYRVHGGVVNREYTYNLMDDHIVNRERTEARKKVYKETEKYYNEKLGTKYAPIGIIEMDDNSITIRCHTYEKDLYKVNMDDKNRLQVIPVIY